MLAAIFRQIESSTQAVIDLQRSLVSMPVFGPQNGGSGEKDRAEFLKKYMKDIGLTEIRELRAPDPDVPCGYRPNLAAVLPGKNTAKTFWVISHMDVVPAGERSQWTGDPFTLRVKGDTLLGRGVEDNQQGIVSSLMAARALLDLKITPDINYGVLLVADEETGSEHGLNYVVRNHDELFRPGDLILVPDFGEPKGELIETAEKSILWLRITVEGRQCHASSPELGRNSLLAAAAFIVRIPELHALFDRRDPLFSPPASTFAPTKMEANVENVNTIPGRDVFYVDCRVLPSYALDDVVGALKRIGGEVEKQYGVGISYETVQREQAAPPTSAESEVVVRLAACIRAVTGRQPRVQGVGGGTVAAFLRNTGHTAAVWATLLDNPHSPDERASIANALTDAKVMAAMLFDAPTSKPKGEPDHAGR